MKIDYNKITITKNLNAYLTEERVAELKQIAIKEKNYLNIKYKPQTIKLILTSRANDIAYKSSKYNSMNDIEKEVLYCNIVLDDEKTARALNSKKIFDRDSLEKFMKILNYIKKRIDSGKITKEDKEYIDYTDKYIKNLIVLFYNYYYVTDYNLIINKINEILSFNPELLETKQTKHTR